MSNFIATIGLVWLSLQFIAPRITRGNVAVSEYSISLVPPALLASMSLIMVLCGLFIATLFLTCAIGSPVNLHAAIDEPLHYAIKELLTNAVFVTGALLISSQLFPALISILNSRWAAVASLPIAVFMTLINLICLTPALI